jgi:hypothetical protein
MSITVTITHNSPTARHAVEVLLHRPFDVPKTEGWRELRPGRSMDVKVDAGQQVHVREQATQKVYG